MCPFETPTTSPPSRGGETHAPLRKEESSGYGEPVMNIVARSVPRNPVSTLDEYALGNVLPVLTHYVLA